MRPALAASVLIMASLLLPPVLQAAGPMAAACQARGGWGAETCRCMQQVADRHMDADEQQLAVAYIQRRTTSAQIAAQSGTAKAQDFLGKFAAFGTESKAKCGAP